MAVPGDTYIFAESKETNEERTKTEKGDKQVKKSKQRQVKRSHSVQFTHPWMACMLKGHSGLVTGMDFSSNGKYLMTASDGMCFNLYNIAIFGWLLVILRIYVALEVFQPYRDLEAGDNQSLKFKWQGRELNPEPLAPQAKSLTTLPPPLPYGNISSWYQMV